MNVHVAKTARDPATARARTLFYASARDGLADLLVDRRRVHPNLSVLLPSFVGWSPHEGSGVLDPVRAAGAQPVFYGLHEDLSIDLDAYARSLEGVEDAVVVLIHYYGRTPAGLREAAAMAHAHGVPVIEDLAHGFFSARTGGVAGSVGDVLMYSLHKMLPTPQGDGGMLTYRNESLLGDQSETRPELARLVLDYDWNAISAARRRNFSLILTGLEEIVARRDDVTLMWPNLGPKEVPQSLPVRVAGGRRDAVYARMNAAGFGMVSLYHTLIPELRADTTMMSVARSVINFPLHQDLDPTQVRPMLAAFEAALDAPADGAQ